MKYKNPTANDRFIPEEDRVDKMDFFNVNFGGDPIPSIKMDRKI